MAGRSGRGLPLPRARCRGEQRAQERRVCVVFCRGRGPARRDLGDRAGRCRPALRRIPPELPGARARVAWRPVWPRVSPPDVAGRGGTEVKGYMAMHRTTAQGAPGGGEAPQAGPRECRSTRRHPRQDRLGFRVESRGIARRQAAFSAKSSTDSTTDSQPTSGSWPHVIGAAATQEHRAVVVAGGGADRRCARWRPADISRPRASRRCTRTRSRWSGDEIALMPEVERDELALIYEAKGMDRDAAERLATQVMADPQRMLAEQVQEELKIGDPAMSPMREALVTGFATGFGAILPVFPFFFWQGKLRRFSCPSRSPCCRTSSLGRRGRSFTGRGVFRDRVSTCSSSGSESPWWATTSGTGSAGRSRGSRARRLSRCDAGTSITTRRQRCCWCGVGRSALGVQRCWACSSARFRACTSAWMRSNVTCWPGSSRARMCSSWLR